MGGGRLAAAANPCRCKAAENQSVSGQKIRGLPDAAVGSSSAMRGFAFDARKLQEVINLCSSLDLIHFVARKLLESVDSSCILFGHVFPLFMRDVVRCTRRFANFSRTDRGLSPFAESAEKKGTVPLRQRF